MGKSKFSSKVQEKIQRGDTQKKSRHVYYDEKIASKGPGMSKNVFVLLIGLIIIGAGAGGYSLLTESNDNGNDDTSNTTPSTVVEGGIQEGDRFSAYYLLWKADVSGYSGVIDTSAEPYDNRTTGAPLEFTTDGVIEGFKNNILGMKEGEEKTFTLESGEGYTSGVLAYYRLTFWVQIFEIL